MQNSPGASNGSIAPISSSDVYPENLAITWQGRSVGPLDSTVTARATLFPLGAAHGKAPLQFHGVVQDPEDQNAIIVELIS